MDEQVTIYVAPAMETIVLHGNSDLLDVSSTGTESYSNNGSSEQFYYTIE